MQIVFLLHWLMIWICARDAVAMYRSQRFFTAAFCTAWCALNWFFAIDICFRILEGK